MRIRAALCASGLLLLRVAGCATAECEEPQSLVVTATAYNSLPEQTNAQPRLTAWGDRLEPGMRAIAVSRDLIRQGLGHGARVRLEGFSGEYVVRDKMARRWKKRIDIYMGEDAEVAREWGRRRLRIVWCPKSQGG